MEKKKKKMINRKLTNQRFSVIRTSQNSHFCMQPMLRIPKSKSRKWKIAENYVWLMRMIMDIWGNSWVMWDNFGARRERSHGNKRKEVSETMREIMYQRQWGSPRKIPEIFYGDSLVFSGENVIYSLLYAVILHKKIDGLNMKRCRLILLVSFVWCFCCVVSRT